MTFGYTGGMRPQTLVRHGLPRLLKRVPGLKALPVFQLIALGEMVLLARLHLQHLQPEERQRMVELVRKGRSLQGEEVEELRGLLNKLEPRAFAGGAVERLSPIPLPKRLTRSRY